MVAREIKGIVFDCFGVLYVGSLQALYEITPRSKWNELRDLSVTSDYGYISREEFLDGAATLTGRNVNDIKLIQSKAHIRNNQLVDYIKQLKHEYKIGLLSNVGRELIQTLFTASELEELFDTTVLSYETGILKPNPHAYELVAERLGLSVGECLMIDDLEKNIEGADAAGMRGIVYSNFDTFKHDLVSMTDV